MSTQHIGRFQELGIALESERGTAESSPDKTIQKLEADFFKKVETEEDLSTRAVLANNQKLDKVSEQVDGGLEMRVHVDTLGYFLKNILGNVSTTEVEDGDGAGLGVYNHEFTVDETILRPTFTVFYKEGDVDEGVVPGTVVDEITISSEADGLVTADLSLLGTTTEDGDFSFSYDEEYDFVGRDITIKKGDDLSDADDNDALDVKEMDITIETGGETDFTMDGSYGPSEIHQTEMQISGSLVLNYDGDEFKDLWDDNEARAYIIEIQSTKNIQTADDTEDEEYPTIKIELPKVFVEDWTRDSSGGDVIQQEVSFRASYDNDEETILNVDLTNNTEDYEN